MSYTDQANLSRDGDFNLRLAACAAVEIEGAQTNPLLWAGEHQWEIAAAPGFADAYASAVAGGVPNPGADTSVISDAMILSAVQALGPDVE
jgi:hypothetical protein